MTSPDEPRAERARRTVDRDILRLAIPSLGALVAEPLFLLVDSAFIARVSTTSLAGLGLASTVLTTIVGLAIFLAYSTTAAVARSFGAGRTREAISRGIDACWLALIVGTLSTLLL
ncbi:MAG: MATE family efflux transporter, partial [Brachybacterium sp.]|nr:MATE family efflux transporter [Brachybacterium sp.]